MNIITKEYINQILTSYVQDIEQVEADLSITNKTLEQACREQTEFPLFYETKKSELNIVCKKILVKIATVRGKLFRQYTEKHSRELGERAKEKYIDAEPVYLEWQELYLAVLELHDAYNAVCSAFITRGYALNNIVKSRVAEVNQIKIY